MMQPTHSIRRLLTLALPCLALAACAKSDKTAPAQSPSDAAQPSDQSAPLNKTIVDIATEAGTFNTLTQALQEADLVQTLQGPGPFTVFAPTDEAFAKLPAGALDDLLKDKEKLKQVLLLHVVSGKVMASDVMSLSTATMLSGQSLPISTTSGVKIGAATVTQTDIEASNGVIHIIDTVLLPQG